MVGNLKKVIGKYLLAVAGNQRVCGVANNALYVLIRDVGAERQYLRF